MFSKSSDIWAGHCKDGFPQGLTQKCTCHMVLISCLTYMKPSINNYELARVLSIEADMQKKKQESLNK